LGIIIAIGLLLFFSGAGTFFCIVFLNEANGAGPWIATIINMVIAFVVVTYVRIKEEWKMSTILAIIGCFGTVQLIIIGTIETPFYWKGDNEWFVRIVSGYCSQLTVCLIGYGISRPFEESFESKTSELVSTIKGTLLLQISYLEEIKKRIASINKKYKQTDHLVTLLGAVMDDKVNVDYVLSRNKRDSELLKEIEQIVSSYNLNLTTQGKTLSAIYMDASKEIEQKKNYLNDFNSIRYSRKDLGTLRSKLKEINQ
jgi:hypothetical protein